ncbi:CARDB domain-containing protein [Halorhabdus rudnickae]|uniref:CARDB domain-containing protein n=1 Tax=Halorhabdus rudnickae TaxID=1775544 RepID=UPI0010827E79|nr:CARDB domain-containing protein [Halorhabdus rudnickae]
MHDVRPSRRVATVVMALCLSATLVVGGPISVEAQNTYLSVTNVSHTPEMPTVGETFEVELTLQNQGESTARSVTINEVYAQTPGQNTYFADDLGRLGPGGSMTVSVPATIDEPGTHSFDVKVNGVDSHGNVVTVRHPVTVRVLGAEKPQIQVDFEREDGIVGVDSEANVTVANGLPDAVRNLRLELDGNGIGIDSPTRVSSELSGAGEQTYAFTLTPTEAGTRSVTAELRYTDGTGETKTVETTETYDVEELTQQLQLDVRTIEGDSAVEVNAVNLGNAPLEDVAVTAESDAATVSTGLIDRIPSQQSRSVRLNVTDITAPRPELRIRAAYDVGGDRLETETTAAAALVPGEVELTGIEITPAGGGTVQLTGTASNVGGTDVSAVTVRVQSDTGVVPSSSGQEYFVGEIEGSDFASFTVNARLADPGNRTTVPLAVTYLVDGHQRRATAEASYEPAPTPDPAQTGGGGLPLVPILVVLVVVGAGVYVWRRRRAD